jgi:hypothetical protein
MSAARVKYALRASVILFTYANALKPSNSQPGSSPGKVVSDYTAEEQNRLRQRFASRAEKYRRHMRITLSCFVGFAVFILSGLLFRPRQVAWVFAPAFLCWLTGIAFWLISPPVTCPGCSNLIGCSNQFRKSFGAYCPECGCEKLKPSVPDGWIRSAYCEGCGKRLRFGKGQSFVIRYCTHCGLKLDERGLR